MDPFYNFTNPTLNQGFQYGAKEVQSSPPVQNIQESTFGFEGPSYLSSDYDDLNILSDDIHDLIEFNENQSDEFGNGSFAANFSLDLNLNVINNINPGKSPISDEKDWHFNESSKAMTDWTFLESLQDRHDLEDLATIDDIPLKESFSPISFKTDSEFPFQLSSSETSNVMDNLNLLPQSSFVAKNVKDQSVKVKLVKVKSMIKDNKPVILTNIKEECSPVKVITIDSKMQQPQITLPNGEIVNAIFKDTIDNAKLKDAINNAKLKDVINNDAVLNLLQESESDSDYYTVESSPESSPLHSPSSQDLSYQNFTEKSEANYAEHSGPIRKRRSRGSRNNPDDYPCPYERINKKKEQNKSAALRYRLKKKKEEEELSIKVEELENEQKRLKKHYNQLKMEAKSAKKFLIEVFKLKGVLK